MKGTKYYIEAPCIVRCHDKSLRRFFYVLWQASDSTHKKVMYVCWVLFAPYNYKRKKYFGVCKKSGNFVHTNFLFLQPRSHLWNFSCETSVKGTFHNWVRSRNKMARRRIAVKEQRSLLPDKKNVGLQVSSTASLSFGDSWENFSRWKSHWKWLN